MRTEVIRLGGREYEFPIYDGKVAANVKSYLYAQPSMLPDELRAYYGELSSQEQDRLQHSAECSVRDMWWENVRDIARNEYPLVGPLQCDGRQGGYLVLEDWSASRLRDLEFDDERSGCSTCDIGLVAPEERTGRIHIDAQREFAGPQLVLPLREFNPVTGAPQSIHPVTCKHCGDFYDQHDRYGCLGYLGCRYAPHEYVSECTKAADEIQAFLARVESLMDPGTLKDDLAASFACEVENHCPRAI